MRVTCIYVYVACTVNPHVRRRDGLRGSVRPAKMAITVGNRRYLAAIHNAAVVVTVHEDQDVICLPICPSNHDLLRIDRSCKAGVDAFVRSTITGVDAVRGA